MATNRYAPPAAQVEDIVEQEVSPALWNPNAAANWSLLFSPAFGAFLHMKNWQVLGEPGKAASAKVWAILSLVVIAGFSCLAVVLPDNKGLDGATRSLGLVLLLTWYFSSGRAQAKYVKEHFGKDYPRKGWGKPILFALLILFGFFVAVFVLAFVGGMLGWL